MELVIETGDAPMPRSRPVKRLSEGERAGLRTQLVDLLDRGWMQHSTAGHAASVVFARKRCGRAGASAATTGASTPSADRPWSRSRTWMRCSTEPGPGDASSAGQQS